jgi:hypothetical protein
LWSAATIFSAYLGVYAVLSATGGYVEESSGEIRWSFGLSVPDVLVWQPRFGRGYSVKSASGTDEWSCDAIGWIYYPVMVLDQQHIHPTIRFRDGNGVIAVADVSHVRMHPTGAP